MAVAEWCWLLLFAELLLRLDLFCCCCCCWAAAATAANARYGFVEAKVAAAAAAAAAAAFADCVFPAELPLFVLLPFPFEFLVADTAADSEPELGRLEETPLEVECCFDDEP